MTKDFDPKNLNRRATARHIPVDLTALEGSDQSRLMRGSGETLFFITNPSFLPTDPTGSLFKDIASF